MSGPSAAARELSERLNRAGAFYDWKPVNEDYTVYLRTPKEYEGRPEWMQAEQPELIHVCSADKFMEAYRSKKKDLLSNFCGYVRDDACQRCASPVHETV